MKVPGILAVEPVVVEELEVPVVVGVVVVVVVSDMGEVVVLVVGGIVEEVDGEVVVVVWDVSDVVWPDVVFWVPDRLRAYTPALRTMMRITTMTAIVATLLIPFLERNL